MGAQLRLGHASQCPASWFHLTFAQVLSWKRTLITEPSCGAGLPAFCMNLRHGATRSDLTLCPTADYTR
jgi:hypothetical protein